MSRGVSPAAVAFCVNRRTWACRSSICFCASTPTPQDGQQDISAMVRVMVVDIGEVVVLAVVMR